MKEINQHLRCGSFVVCFAGFDAASSRYFLSKLVLLINKFFESYRGGCGVSSGLQLRHCRKKELVTGKNDGDQYQKKENKNI